MKIGLVTWYGAGNFGTGLQAYALMTYLKKKGHDISFVQCFNLRNVSNIFISTAHFVKRKIVALKRHFFPKYREGCKEMTIARRETCRYFIDKFIPLFPFVEFPWQYESLLRTMDCFITGSDQIWNPFHSNPFYLLDFVKGKPCYAYASSIGVNELPEEFKPTYKKELSKFRQIGVREQRGADIVNELLGNDNAIQVLDPTFLLKPDEWKDFAEGVDTDGIKLGSYMLVYTIGRRPEYPGFIKAIQKEYCIEKVIVARSFEGLPYTDVDLQLTKISPMHFVYLLRNARLVCTDSFHATALSINHNKNFIELLRFDPNDFKSQNSRIYDVLSHYGVRERLYTGGFLPREEIDFTFANDRLAKDRAASYAFIDECLADVENEDS